MDEKESLGEEVSCILPLGVDIIKNTYKNVPKIHYQRII